jgi:cytochrome bd-type quinol oxidase subunit 2
MAEVLFVLLLVLGVLGAVIFTLRRRGWMRNGYFTIGTSILIAFIVMLAYQSLAPILLLLFPGADTENTKLLLAMNALAQLVVLVGGSFLLIRATEQDANATLRLEGVKQTPIELYLLGPFIMLFTTIVSGAISQFWIKLLKPLPFYSELEKLQTMNEELITKLTSASNSFELLVVVLAVAIVLLADEHRAQRQWALTSICRAIHRIGHLCRSSLQPFPVSWLARAWTCDGLHDLSYE